MALTDGENGNGFYMPVAPAYNGGFGNGNNGFGGDWAWIILLLLLGWGNNGNGFGGGFGGNSDFPWLMTGQQNINANTNSGFRDAMLNDGITSIRDGIGNLSTQLCNCCGDMQMALANGFAGVEQGANARQMADMNQAFAAQTAMAQGFNNLGSQLAECCCENRLGIANLGSDLAREACADRAAVTDGVRDIIANQTAGIQTILDKLCSQELEAERRENANLRTQLNMANLQASQTAQTGRILADNAAQTVALEQYLNPVPVPAYVVQNPNCCPQNNCGCNL